MINQIKLDDFLLRNRIEQAQWHASGLLWNDLVSIGIEHERQIPHLESTAILLANTIQRFDSVHSVRWRIKDVEHLLVKIIRKRIDRNKKYDDICLENYRDVITDLIGIRALHLFKTDFETINKSIINSFDLKEKTVVYVREGDDPTFKQQCSDLGFSVEVHPNGYRSIHYVLTTQPLQRPIHVELQVRTIFEEGWSEIDHIVRYPNYSDDAQLAYLLTIFNRMAGSADEMAGFVRALAEAQRDAKAQLDDAKAQLDDALRQLSDVWRKNGESLAKDESAPERVASNNAPIEAVQDALQNLKSRIEAMEDPGGIKAYLKSIEGPAGIRVQLRAIEDPSGIKALMKEIEDPGGIKALMKEIEDPGGIKALMKEIEDPSGIKALMKEIEDPSGIKALMKEIEDPSGIKALMKEIEDPSGIKALMKEVEDPGGIKALMKNTKDPGGISNI